MFQNPSHARVQRRVARASFQPQLECLEARTCSTPSWRPISVRLLRMPSTSRVRRFNATQTLSNRISAPSIANETIATSIICPTIY